MVDVVVDVLVNGAESGPEFGGGVGLVGCEERAQEPVAEFGVEDDDAGAVGGEDVAVGPVDPGDNPGDAQVAQVVGHLAGGVGSVQRPLPRYLPAEADSRLVRALEASPSRLRAGALLLLRATGLRIGELVDLELDCVHEVPGQGAWLKVPLGKLATERMIPLDSQTVDLIDQIVGLRSPGLPLRHPRTGRPADFLLTHQGRRISAESLRVELHRAAREAGISEVVPHTLRHSCVICTASGLVRDVGLAA